MNPSTQARMLHAIEVGSIAAGAIPVEELRALLDRRLVTWRMRSAIVAVLELTEEGRVISTLCAVALDDALAPALRATAMLEAAQLLVDPASRRFA